LVQSIQNLTETGRLPNVNLKDLERNTVSSNDLFERKTILYFWSVKNENHFFAVHKKLQNLMEKHPDLDVMAVNLDESFENWKAFLNKNKPILNSKIKHYQASDLEDIKEKWVIMRQTRASIIDQEAKIIKGFVNIFDSTFEKQL